MLTGDGRETEDYPGLVVDDERVSGSITAGRSRLPLWAFTGMGVVHGWQEVETGWPDIEGPYYRWSAEKQAEFLTDLLELRGDFGRLICVLADAERRERSRGDTPWWERPKTRKRVLRALLRCVEALERDDG